MKAIAQKMVKQHHRAMRPHLRVSFRWRGLEHAENRDIVRFEMTISGPTEDGLARIAINDLLRHAGTAMLENIRNRRVS